MKKIFTLVVCALMAFSANAQIQITKDGKEIKDGETVEFFAEEQELFPGFSILECSPSEPLIKNLGSSTSRVDVTVKQEHSMDLTWCIGVDKDGNLGAGSCSPISGLSESKFVNLPANKSVGLDLHAMNFTSGQYKTYTAQIKITANNKTTNFTIKFIYSDPAGIEDTHAAEQVKVSNNVLSYNFGSNADRQLNVYGVSGRLVKSSELAQHGNISLAGLHRGVYIYEIVANGKRVAAHKFVVK